MITIDGEVTFKEGNREVTIAVVGRGADAQEASRDAFKGWQHPFAGIPAVVEQAFRMAR